MDDVDGIEIMPRPPQSHRHWTGATDALAVVSEQLRLATDLHERFLAAQADFQAPRPPASAALGPARTARTDVEVGGWYIDRAGRMMAGAVLQEVLALLPRQNGAFDCELTFHSPLPVPGDQLQNSLTVTETSFHGGTVGRLSLHGTTSAGLDLGRGPEHVGDAFGPAAVTAFAEGRPADCFTGQEWELTRTHVRSPGIGTHRTLLLHEITAFDRSRALCADGRTPPDTWHVPAALLEGCFQALAFHLAATGCTIRRDGWRFEPLPDQPARVRWLAHTPGHTPRYSITVQSSTDTTVHADAVCTIDGRVVLRAERLAVRLVQDTPLPHWRLLGPPAVQRTGDPLPPSALSGLRGHHDTAAATVGQVRYDHAAMLAAAWGPMSEVFPGAGDDSYRLPGPPYLFITRVAEVSGTPGSPQAGSRLVAEYDVPEQAWFREQSGTVPIAALMEAALQPCGFLAAHLDGRTASDEQICVRNLDGDLATNREVPSDVRMLRTTVELLGLARWDGTALGTFRIGCEADGVPVLDGTAVFAFTPAARLASPSEMTVTDADRARLALPCDRPVIDLRSRPRRFFGHSARLPGPMLLMLDRITGYWPDGGSAGLGRLRAECDVRADAWYFTPHFFNDPVQPGSLGVEAMYQLLCWFLIERGVDDGLRFEPVVPAAWTYRGQVVPADSLVTIELDVLAVVLGTEGGHAEAEAWLWVDGRRAYHVPRLRVRVTPGEPDSPTVVETVLDPRSDTWLADHCPTWTVPAVPLMSTADLLARAAGDRAGREVRVLRDLRMQRWLPVTGPTRLRLTCLGDTARLAVWHEAGTLSRFVPAAAATLGFDVPPRPERFPALPHCADAPDPYESADLFHGPSFQYLTSLRMGSAGSSGVLDARRGSVPRGLLHQGLLDAALHVIPHNAVRRWAPDTGHGMLAFPHLLTELVVFDPLPDGGEIEVEARFGGVLPENLIVVNVQLCQGERVLVAFQLVEMLVPAGPLAQVSGPERRAYLRDGKPNPALLLSTADGMLRRQDVEQIDALAGTANAIYGLPVATRATDWLPHIALKEHIARHSGVHPRSVEVTNLDNVSWDTHSATVRTT
ncbi:hypothetical protein [Streptomyces sp. NPDC050485]|uniref:hypothetical protein n=1 Tax=Streptomyces sp. NPDC050485 TaxID=3365617 RepID=UPI0037B1E145